ncbi:DUF4012 domain-containing protein [Patescibacteria group bacterium]|nr:DUF4012 domain-containing protein [Patescibacteria group bacterium]
MTEIPSLLPNQEPPMAPPKRLHPILKATLYILTAFFALLLVIGIFAFTTIYLPGKEFLTQVNQLKNKQAEIQSILASKDLNKMKSEVASLRQDQQNLAKSYQKLAILSAIPIAKNYYSDGQQLLSITSDGLDTADIVIKAIEPYQDFIGFKGSATNSAKTTEDRIAFLTDSIEGIVPQLNVIEQKISKIQDSLDKIDASRYPEEYKGFKIQSNILKAQEVVGQVDQFLKDGQPILSKTSWLLGKDTPRQYLLLFQNDAELRPTGGFWTAYGILKVDKGKITPVASDDIYSLDSKLKSTVPAPRPIKAYHINVPYWNIRDMNISPDFPTSIETMLPYFQKADPADKFDAIVGLDTQVLVDFVKVLGRVGVPGWGNFTPEPDKRCGGCPQIIYQLEYIAGKPRNYIDTQRKGFLGPLMHSLLANAMGSPKEKIGPLAEGLLNDIYEKHMLFYFVDKNVQAAAVQANIAGAIAQVDKNTDYLHINDANMSSNKTNLFLSEKIKHEIISTNGKVEHKITITYTDPFPPSNCNLEKGDLCLNAQKYRDWFRFYVPTGSQLVKMTGSEVEPVLYEELGKQVFEGFYGNKYPLFPPGSLRTSVQYTSSVAPSSSYTLLLQKQPGTKPIPYELWVNGQKYETFNWTADKTIKLSL